MWTLNSNISGLHMNLDVCYMIVYKLSRHLFYIWMPIQMSAGPHEPIFTVCKYLRISKNNPSTFMIKWHCVWLWLNWTRFGGCFQETCGIKCSPMAPYPTPNIIAVEEFRLKFKSCVNELRQLHGFKSLTWQNENLFKTSQQNL